MPEVEKEVPNQILEDLMSRRTVTLSGEITRESMDQVGRRLLTLQTRSIDPINLIIDSGGGDTFAALRFCDLMTSLLTVPIRGIALGVCGSAATFIMLHCKERVSTAHAQFLIHSGIRSKISIPVNQTTSENLEQLLKETKRIEEMVLRLYASRLTPDTWAKREPTDDERRTFVQQLINRGDQRFNDWITAEEALEIGLIEKIVRGNLGIFPE